MNKFESSHVVKSFRENFNSASDSESDHFVCGVSGGIDSMTLLFLLHRHNINCTVVHCNYRLRGEASEHDREFVEEISAMWNFDCITATFDPEEAEVTNTQLWAREKRYTVFRDIKREAGAQYILTAHHQDDQVETILQKILRGSGLPSWKGMDVQQGDLLRPLLGVTKEQILHFTDEHHIPFREDSTNRSAGYARNFLRQKLMPDMDSFFPGWRDNVLKVPDRSEEYSLMSGLILKQILNDENQIRRSDLIELPEKLRPSLFHRYLSKRIPDLTLTEGVLNRFLAVEKLQTGAEIEISPEWKIIRDRDLFLLVRSEEQDGIKPKNLSREDLTEEKRIGNYRLVLRPWSGNIQSSVLQLDSDKVEWPVRVRPWRDGDRIQPLGMKGSKLVADILTDKKIASSQKRAAFLIESFDGIICAVIFPHITNDGQTGIISERVKCSSATKQILQIDTDL